MSLRILEGRAGTGKTTACLNEMKTCSSVLIVPEQYSFRMGKLLLEENPVSGFDGAQVFSFRRLASLLEGEVRGRTAQFLSGSERTLLLSHLILRNQESLTAIRPHISAAEEIGELIAELKKYRILVKDLKTVCADMQESLLKRKLTDVALLYEQYEMCDKLDGEDRFDLLANNIPESAWLSSTEVYIDQFTGFSPQEMEIIRALLRTAKRVTVVLTTDRSAEPQFEMIHKTRKELAAMAAEEGETVEIVSFDQNRKHQKDGALFFLEKEFFHYPHEEFKKEPTEIEVFEASGRQSEITHLVSAITRLLKEGYRYRDIAVVSRDSENYETEIMTEFTRFKIPYFLDKKMPLLHHRVSTALLSAISIISYGWKYEDVFRYLKCGYSGLSLPEIDRLENYVLAAGIRGRAWYQEEAWDMPYGTYGAEKRDEEIAEMDQLRRKVAAPLYRLKEGLSGEVLLHEAADAMLSFIREIGLGETLSQEAKEGGREGEEDAQVYEELQAVLQTLRQSLGEERVSAPHFGELLRTGLSQSAVGAIPHSLDHVQISDITRSKGSGAKVIFMIGVCDGLFPKQGGVQGFFSDSNRHVLEEKGILLAPDSRGRAFMEQNLIYAALTGASDKLYLSYPVADSDGKSLRPSQIIHRLHLLFPNLKEKNDLKGTLPEDRITTAKGTFEPMLAALRREQDGLGVAEKEYKEALLWYQNHPSWQEKTQKAEEMFMGAMKAASLTEEEARALYGEHLYTSISRLETYRSCPYLYFAKYGLRLRERTVAGMNPADSGSFLHKILEDFSRNLEEKGLRWRELSNEKMEELLEDVLPEIYDDANAYLLKESPRTAFLLGRLKKTAMASLEVVRDHLCAGVFEPMGYELSFGEGEELQPLVIPIRGGSCTLRGKIDRADKLETPNGTYFRVVDYKSGSKDFDLGETYHGLSLQLAVYLYTLCENEKEKGVNAHPGAMVYFRIKDPVIEEEPSTPQEDISKKIHKEMRMNGLFLKDDEVLDAMDTNADGASLIIPLQKKKDGTYKESNSLATADQFRALFSHVEKTVQTIAQEMLSGRIEAKPARGKRTPCEYCEYRAVCGFDDKIDAYRYDKKEKLKCAQVWERLGVEES